MNIDRIKVSVEYTYHGLSRWVGMEASLYNATTKDGKRLPTNPMPEIASRTAISQGNTAKAFSLVQDV